MPDEPSNHDVRASQVPLRAAYLRDPSAASVIDIAWTSSPDASGDPMRGRVHFGSHAVAHLDYGVHRAIGGTHAAPVPGDLLCAALASCQESSLRMVANVLGVRLHALDVAVQGQVDVRGTLGDVRVPVAFQRFDVRVVLRAAHDTHPVRLGQLCRAAERACVVLQTLRTGVPVTVTFDAAVQAPPAADASIPHPMGAPTARRSRSMTLQTNPVPAANPNKALWEKGDFTRIAASMRKSGEALVQSIGITPRMKVLDLGCGDGTTALPAARLGADVLGVDIAPNLVQAANRRAAEAGLANLRVVEGDASDLSGVENKTFDRVVSIFGAMFAPRPFDVAREMVRVTRPGGRIVMGNWIPGDPTLVAQILKISASCSPPPPEGFVSPVTWGLESHVVERFTAAGIPKDRIACAMDSYTFEFAGTPQEFVNTFRHYYGPTMNAFDAAAKNGKAEALREDLETLFIAQNRSTRADVTSIPANFLRVTVQVD